MDTQHLMPLDSTLGSLFAAGDPRPEGKEQERANVACLERIFGALATGDFDAFAAELADDVEMKFFSPPELPFRRSAWGKAEARALTEHNFGVLTEQLPQLLSLTAQGDSLVVVGRESGKVKETGQPYDVHFVYHFRFRGGKLLQALQYTTLTDWAQH